MTNSRDVADEPGAAGRGVVTITDVANAAGVSASTVSYVITGKRTISPATRRRVEETIRALGYRRRTGSPAPAPARAGVLAVAMPLRDEQHVGVELEFFSAAAGAARRLGFDLLLVTDDDGTAALHRVTSAALADAVIVLDAGDGDPRVPVLLASGRPAVLVGAPGRRHGLAALTLDFMPSGKDCATHLADLGHRSVAHLEPAAALPSHRRRYLEDFTAGFGTTATRRGVRTVSRPCAPEEAARCLDDLLADDGPTALVVHDEIALPHVLAAVADRGMRVPEDISVVAVCSSTVADHQRIRPTAVLVPARRLGARAVERAVRQLDGTAAAEPEVVIPRLTPGESTGPAPANGLAPASQAG
ncbi:LacI family DNA-binding transcriptional regulator [Amycolatopsis sp. NEAU-NG30]|uniref:LacI family DNA-binding transcriptional regulator n=1 Tax=Amycolatopsis melonis TaxID=3156488 RepID=A0ABV0L713_9PSEU